jgi:hypothetical protein
MSILLLAQKESIGDVDLYGTDILQDDLPSIRWTTDETEDIPSD